MTVAILLRAPGAGKGTQAPAALREPRRPRARLGDLLRAEVASGSEIGREVDAIMRSASSFPTS
jgi:adenylate kinase